MKRPVLAALAAAPALAVTAMLALAQDAAPVRSLRGAQPDGDVPLGRVCHQLKGRESRNDRQQPPMIPHSVEKYQIDVRANECLACHDWRNAPERNAPTLSMTHYLDRNGIQTDNVATRRWSKTPLRPRAEPARKGAAS